MEELEYCDKCGYAMEWLDECEYCGDNYCEYCGIQGEGSYRELLDLQMDYNFKKEQIKEITNLILETIKQNKI